MPNEDYSIVLDYLPRGKSTGYRSEPLCQILGMEFFTILEAVPKADLVVMNPTHYAVAIQYDDASMSAPRVIAKGADLLVMGCYGHSRAREWVLGGTSRTVLRSMTLPVLMAH